MIPRLLRDGANFIYRMTLPALAKTDVCKIGRTNDLPRRAKDHSAASGVPGVYEWQSSGVWIVQSANDAIELERLVLDRLVADGLKVPGPQKEQFSCGWDHFRQRLWTASEEMGIPSVSLSSFEDFLEGPEIDNPCSFYLMLDPTAFELALHFYSEGKMSANADFDRYSEARHRALLYIATMDRELRERCLRTNPDRSMIATAASLLISSVNVESDLIQPLHEISDSDAYESNL